MDNDSTTRAVPAIEPEYEREFIAGPDYARRVTRALVRQSFTRPAFVTYVVVVGIAWVVVTLGGLAVLIGGGGWLPLAIAAAVPVLFVVFRFWNVRTVLVRARVFAFEGARYAVRVGDHSMKLLAPFSTGDVEYAAFDGVFLRNDVVMLKYRKAQLYTMLPAELFASPADFAATVQASIDASRRR